MDPLGKNSSSSPKRLGLFHRTCTSKPSMKAWTKSAVFCRAEASSVCFEDLSSTFRVLRLNLQQTVQQAGCKRAAIRERVKIHGCRYGLEKGGSSEWNLWEGCQTRGPPSIDNVQNTAVQVEMAGLERTYPLLVEFPTSYNLAQMRVKLKLYPGPNWPKPTIVS